MAEDMTPSPTILWTRADRVSFPHGRVGKCSAGFRMQSGLRPVSVWRCGFRLALGGAESYYLAGAPGNYLAGAPGRECVVHRHRCGF